MGRSRYYNEKGDIQNHSLTQAIENLIEYMHIGEDGVNGFHTVNWNLILALPSSNLTDWFLVDIPGEIVMAELYLWNKQYAEAKNAILKFMIADESGKSKVTDMNYNISASYQLHNWKQLFINNSSTLFKEMVAVVPFDLNNNQVNNLQRYFSNEYPNQYYLAPSSHSIDNWRYQEGLNELGDKARGDSVSYSNKMGIPTVIKYDLDPENEVYQSDTDIPIYRAAELHLMLAEAYCFLGEFEVAMAVINDGLIQFYANGVFSTPVKDIMPQGMQLNIGLRKRAGLRPILVSGENSLFPSAVSQQDSIVQIGRVIANETALELAYEGKRWFTLLRMARNLNMPIFIANEIAKKYEAGESDRIKQELSNFNNCYLKVPTN